MDYCNPLIEWWGFEYISLPFITMFAQTQSNRVEHSLTAGISLLFSQMSNRKIHGRHVVYGLLGVFNTTRYSLKPPYRIHNDMTSILIWSKFGEWHTIIELCRVCRWDMTSCCILWAKYSVVVGKKFPDGPHVVLDYFEILRHSIADSHYCAVLH